MTGGRDGPRNGRCAGEERRARRQLGDERETRPRDGRRAAEKLNEARNRRRRPGRETPGHVTARPSAAEDDARPVRPALRSSWKRKAEADDLEVLALD